MAEQLDLFAAPKGAKENQQKPSWPGLNIVCDHSIPRNEMHIVSGEQVTKIVNIGHDKEYGDRYLAKGIARWSVFCFLWSSGNGDVCAPYFGDSQDAGWKPRWIDMEQAKAMLADAGYFQRSVRINEMMPCGSRHGNATVYRYPEEGERKRRSIEARKEKADADLFAMPVHIGMDGPEAHDFYKLLCALRRGAESDDLFRKGKGVL